MSPLNLHREAKNYGLDEVGERQMENCLNGSLGVLVSDMSSR